MIEVLNGRRLGSLVLLSPAEFMGTDAQSEQLVGDLIAFFGAFMLCLLSVIFGHLILLAGWVLSIRYTHPEYVRGSTIWAKVDRFLPVTPPPSPPGSPRVDFAMPPTSRCRPLPPPPPLIVSHSSQLRPPSSDSPRAQARACSAVASRATAAKPAPSPRALPALTPVRVAPAPGVAMMTREPRSAVSDATCAPISKLAQSKLPMSPRANTAFFENDSCHSSSSDTKGNAANARDWLPPPHVEVEQLSHSDSSSSINSSQAQAVPWLRRLRYSTLSRLETMPAILCWPNIEVIVIVLFSAGMLKTSTAVLAGYSNGIINNEAAVALAVLEITLLGAVFTHELARLLFFYCKLRADRSMWLQAPIHKNWCDVDDPFFRTLTKYHLVKPAPRLQGRFVALEDEDFDEAARTWRLIAGSLGCRWWRQPLTDIHTTLASSWAAGSCNRRGLAYQPLRVLVQVWFGIAAGIGVRDASRIGVDAHSVGVAFLVPQAALGLYCLLCVPAADRLENAVVAWEALLSALSILLQLISATSKRDARQWRSAAAASLLVAICLPFALAIYDCVTCYIFRRGIWARTKRQMQVAAVVDGGGRQVRISQRGYAVGSWSLEQKAAASKIGAAARGRQGRIAARRRKRDRDDQAASCIGATFRGQSARRQLEKQRSDRAATVINTHARGKLTRRQEAELAERRRQERLARREERRRQAASTTISTHARGYLERKRHEQRQERRRVRRVSATTINAAVRGHIARARAAKALDEVVRARAQEAARQRRRQRRDAQIGAAARINAYARGWRYRRIMRLAQTERSATSTPAPAPDAVVIDAPSASPVRVSVVPAAITSTESVLAPAPAQLAPAPTAAESSPVAADSKAV